MKKIKKIKKLKKSKKKPAQELRLLTRGNVTQLSKFKKKARLSKAGREFVSWPDAKVSGELFDNQIFENLLTVEELAVIFGLAPRTIRNWIARREIPHVKIGRRNFLQKRSVQKWLNQKEEPQWQ